MLEDVDTLASHDEAGAFLREVCEIRKRMQMMRSVAAPKLLGLLGHCLSAVSRTTIVREPRRLWGDSCRTP